MRIVTKKNTLVKCQLFKDYLKVELLDTFFTANSVEYSNRECCIVCAQSD
jgi:hypothetical protein